MDNTCASSSFKKNQLIQEAEQQRLEIKNSFYTLKDHTYTLLSFKFWLCKAFPSLAVCDHSKFKKLSSVAQKLSFLTPVAAFLINRYAKRSKLIRLTSWIWGGWHFYKKLKSHSYKRLKLRSAKLS
ncbi:MAG: hypothetical protein V4525_16700 [Pseudomonadota bacterium]